LRPLALLALPALLLAAAATRADEPLRVDGASLGADGVLTRRAADVMGNDAPSRTTLLVVDAPPPTADALRGRVETFEIDGEGWLELVAAFADGSARAVRALAADGTDARLRGTAPAREFALAIPRAADGSAPARLELAVGLLGPGVVSVSELRLEPARDAPAPGGPTVPRGSRFALAALAGLALGAALALRRRRAQASAPR
jgi:hypothetical protein